MCRDEQRVLRWDAVEAIIADRPDTRISILVPSMSMPAVAQRGDGSLDDPLRKGITERSTACRRKRHSRSQGLGGRRAGDRAPGGAAPSSFPCVHRVERGETCKTQWL